MNASQYTKVVLKQLGYDHAYKIALRSKEACKHSTLPEVKAVYEFWTHVVGILASLKTASKPQNKQVVGVVTKVVRL